MKKCVQSQYKSEKSHFLNHNWYLQKLCCMFIPVVFTFIGASIIVYCIILAIKSFCKTLKYELNTLWDDVDIFKLWYVGWRIWNQKNAAEYLYGVDEK
jgi:hypothetical protein